MNPTLTKDEASAHQNMASRVGAVLKTFGYEPSPFQVGPDEEWVWRKKIEGFDFGYLVLRMKTHPDGMVSVSHKLTVAIKNHGSIIESQTELPFGEGLLAFAQATFRREVALQAGVGAVRAAWV